MTKIVILDGHAVNPGDLSWDEIKALGDVEIYENSTYEEALLRAKDADIIINNKVKLDSNLLSKCEKVRLVSLLSTGYDVVDVNYCKEHNIKVTNVPSYSSRSVAQLTIAHLLEIAMGVGLHDRSVKNDDWANSPNFCYWNQDIIELAGKTIGIVGYGSIGKYVAEISNALGMNVVAFNRSHEIKESFVKKVSLDELFKESDIISLHCPLNEGSKNLINKDSISKMKNGAIVINTARGGLVVEEDVNEALNSGKLLGYAADVLRSEPPQKDNKLLKNPKAYITPHIAWASVSARKRLMEIAVNNIKSFLAGNVINNVY